MINHKIKTITVLLLLLITIVTMAQEEPPQDSRTAMPVHEITGSSDMLGVEVRVIDEPVPFRAKEITHLAESSCKSRAKLHLDYIFSGINQTT